MTGYHFSQSVTGPLSNWKKRDWKRACNWCIPKGGGKFTPDELKDQFLKLLADGWEVIPIGNGCDNFDKKEGCLGHPMAEQTTP